MPEFETMFLSGDRADQPDPEDADQKLYQVEDEGNILERSDGVAWTPYGPQNTGGGLILVENKLFTAAATTYDFAGLDGDAHGYYLMQLMLLVGASGTPFFMLRLNGQATTYNTQRVQTLNGTVGTSSNSFTEAYIGGGDAGTCLNITANIFAQKVADSVAKTRGYNAMSMGIVTTGCANLWQSRYADTVTNLTLLRLHCDTSNGIGDGSRATLYRYGQS